MSQVSIIVSRKIIGPPGCDIYHYRLSFSLGLSTKNNRTRDYDTLLRPNAN